MPSRISGACNGCRTKKQKCSGDRNGCAQCAAASIVCTWPEQRKRGPAKGYIEGLEHRLHEAETLLLQLLPVVTTTQLSAATTTLALISSTHDSPEHMPSGRSSPPILNKKTGIEYWENFPLDTVENIRRWQADCAIHSNFRDEFNHSRNASRSGSMDLQRESSQPTLTPTTARKQSSMSQQPFRNMSTGSYHPTNITPTSQAQSAYISAQLQSQPSQQQQWTSTNFMRPDATSNVMQTGYSGTNDQSWQQQQQHNQFQQQQQHHQQNQMAMEIDNGFFPADMKKNLFW